MVFSPELTVVNKITTPENKSCCSRIKKHKLRVKTDIHAARRIRKKNGRVHGAPYAINPVNQARYPYFGSRTMFLMSYGTGAIMACACADETRFCFCQKSMTCPLSK